MNAIKDRIEVMNLIQNIATADSESTVRMMTRSVITRVGAESFIYSTLRVNQSGQEFRAHHYFEDCRSEWRSIYEDRRWYMNDPLIEYAKLHTEPAVCSKIVPITRGQTDMLEAAARHGFRSGIVVPAHSRLGAQQCLGVLFIGSSGEPANRETLFLSHRIVLRALAMELMEWWKNHFKKLAIQKFKIKQLEIQMLEHLSNGRSVAEISAILDMKPSTLYHQLAILKDKLSAGKTNDAVLSAKAHGLLM